jgi:hypothetical protein
VRYLQNHTANGPTPEPCSGFKLFADPSEPHPQDGLKAITPARDLMYQLNEGRLGPDGQAANYFLNGLPSHNWTTVTPFVWAVIQFDAHGKMRPLQSGDNFSNIQIFNTFQVYKGLTGLPSIPQSPHETFISLDATSYYRIPQ